jgi:hypothetical protein
MLALLASAAFEAGRAGALDEAGPVPAAARASTPAGVRLTLGTGLTLGLSDVETRAGDAISVSSAFYRWNVGVASHWPVSHAWAIGARGSWSSDAGARGTEASSLWQLGAEVRHQPRGWLGPYVSASAGAAAARDSVDDSTVTQWAPALGAAAGYDVGVGAALAIGLELRGGVAVFDPDGGSLQTATEAVTVVYGTTSWLSLNLTGQLGL